MTVTKISSRKTCCTYGHGHLKILLRLSNIRPVLDENLVPMGPGSLPGTGAGVWRKAPGAFPDSSQRETHIEKETVISQTQIYTRIIPKNHIISENLGHVTFPACVAS